MRLVLVNKYDWCVIRQFVNACTFHPTAVVAGDLLDAIGAGMLSLVNPGKSHDRLLHL